MRYSARIKHQRDIANMGTSKPHSSRKIKSLVDLEKKLTSSPHHPSNIYEARFNPRAMICSLDLGSFDYNSPPLTTNPPSCPPLLPMTLIPILTATKFPIFHSF